MYALSFIFLMSNFFGSCSTFLFVFLPKFLIQNSSSISTLTIVMGGDFAKYFGIMFPEDAIFFCTGNCYI